MLLLGYDLGSSSVKASLLDAESGKVLASAYYPEQEMDIDAPRAGWAEQDPENALEDPLADAAAVATWTHPATVNCLAASADNLKLATGSDDNVLRIWDVASGRVLEHFLDHTEPVSAVAFAPDNKTVVSGSAGGNGGARSLKLPVP